MLKSTTTPVALLIFTLLIVSPADAYAQDRSGDDCYAHVVHLSKDIGCRVTGSHSNEMAGNYISQRFIEYGLNVRMQEFGFESRFCDDCEEISNGKNITGKNIIGILEGKSKKKIIIGAHYDTVPNAPGANDNAAGVGVLLGLAKSLSNKNLNHTLVFIAFDGEEHGLIGSSYYLENVENPETIEFMINIDSVGRGNILVPMVWNHESSHKDFFQSGYLQSPLWLTSTIYKEAKAEGLSVYSNIVKDQLQLVLFDQITNPVYSMSDSGVFLENNIPSAGYVMYKIQNGSNNMKLNYAHYIPDIHTKNDTYDKIEVQNLEIVEKIITNSILTLDKEREAMTHSSSYGGGLLVGLNKNLFSIPWWAVFLSFSLMPLLISITIFIKSRYYFIVIAPSFISLALLVLIKDSEPFSAITTGIKTNLVIFIIFLILISVMETRRYKMTLLFTFSIVSYLIGSMMFFVDLCPINTPAVKIYLIVSLYIISQVIYSYFSFGKKRTRKHPSGANQL
nr:hypothetical membrane protein, peptidase M28 family [uncultured archaeon]